MISEEKIKEVRNEIIRREKELDEERIENIRIYGSSVANCAQ